MDKYLIISAHDYRTPRRASMHFLADELAKKGKVRFFSLRYSYLSSRKGDMRQVIDDRANRIETVNGVECFLWKTPLHPFNTRKPALRPFENILFELYKALPSKVLRDWIQQSSVIIFESGLAPIYFDLAKSLNPHARFIYRASDDLETINVADYVHKVFSRAAPEMNAICMLSPRLADNIASQGNLYYVPNGVDPDLDSIGDPSPYTTPGPHAVSVGSMLFDKAFFEFAGHAFPEVSFHVIGSGLPRQPGYADNVIVYPDMKYADTVRYIKHATIGIAPYVSSQVPNYLADSSLKLLQYDYFALPSVCPHTVVGSYSSRFGYTPGNNDSIRNALAGALAAPRIRTRECYTWEQVTARLIDPDRYPDTHIPAQAPLS